MSNERQSPISTPGPIARAYVALLRAGRSVRIQSGQSRHVAQTIVPLIQDNSWFFDTELLVLASRLVECGSTRCRFTGSRTTIRGYEL